jgi:hypothetical protein
MQSTQSKKFATYHTLLLLAISAGSSWILPGVNDFQISANRSLTTVAENAVSL